AASSACVPSRTVIFSGQYGTRTGATQTDGGFKDGADPDFPWLDPEAFPTLGSWMRASGYTTHYFGKWHVSGEAPPDLEAYGFSDWDLSYPDPHGSLPNNLGYYRDYQFEDLTTSFLRRQGLGVPYDIGHATQNAAANDPDREGEIPKPKEPAAPWFAVCSFTNPHDIGGYPALPRQVYDSVVEGAPYTLAVPPQGAKAELPHTGTMAIELNRLGFPQNNANVSPTWDEALHNKPDCQLDYAYKMGLALTAQAAHSAAMQTDLSPEEKWDYAVDLTLNANEMGIPLALTDNPEHACRAFMQYYACLMHEVDRHINAVLRALDESGQADNTIVIFTPDHGEYGGAHHMMTEKWHTSYDEFLHVPMVVRFPTDLYLVPGGVKQVSDPTSHVDILPTVLGLAGVDAEKRGEIKTDLMGTHSTVLDPVGADLSRRILGEEDIVKMPGSDDEREGVLFMTHDTITEPLPPKIEPLSRQLEPVNTNGTAEFSGYAVFLAAVEKLRAGGDGYPEEVEHLAEGPVTQPNHVHSVVSKDGWKFVRYFDPEHEEKGMTRKNQYELYNLNADPNEQYNLLIYNAAGEDFPKVVDTEDLPEDLRDASGNIRKKAKEMMELLTRLEEQMLPMPLEAGARSDKQELVRQS
ncbi:MAG: hypothetical protein ETSY2_04315, partial [Candidatus Entotheonella gemina]